VLVESEKGDSPNYEAKCKLKIKVTVPNDVVYEHTTKEYTVGEEDIPEGLQKAIDSMKKGETARFKIKSEYGYKAEGSKELNIPPNTDLVYEIELIECEKGKESWQLSNFQEKHDVAVHRKNIGNTFFEKQKFALAIQKYEKALDLLKFDTNFADEEKKKIERK